jgi:hypothetical protein
VKKVKPLQSTLGSTVVGVLAHPSNLGKRAKTCGKCGSKIDSPGPCKVCKDAPYGLIYLPPMESQYRYAIEVSDAIKAGKKIPKRK